MDLKEILLEDEAGKAIEGNLENILKSIPELRFIIGFETKRNEELWNRVLKAISISKKDFDVRLSLLLYKIDEIKGVDKEEITRNILSRLNYDEIYINKINYLISNYNKPISKQQTLADIEISFKLYEIQRCDRQSKEKENIRVLYSPRNISC